MARAKRAQQDDELPPRDRKPRRGPGLRRLIAALALMPLASRAPLYARLVWALVTDPRTPRSRKAILAVAAGYVVLGRDIVPDWVPLLGQLDDLVVVALAAELFLDGLDDALVEEKLDQVGIARQMYDEDVARIRRLMPGPVRRAARRLPDAARFVADAAAKSGAGPGLRRWIDRGPAAA